MYAIYHCSPKAEALLPTEFDKTAERKEVDAEEALKARVGTVYPFARLGVGQCFIVGITEDKALDNRLRVAASKHGKRLGRKFTVIRHDEHKCYELARIQ